MDHEFKFYNTAKCHSSRVSLLTGLYCDQAGSEKLSRGAMFTEVLSRAGYCTAMSGKWLLSKQPTDFGFDRFWGHLSGAVNYITGDHSFRLNGEPWEVPETLNGRPFYTTHAITDFALNFLREAADSKKPFLLYVAYNAPHYPLQAPEAAVRRCEGRYDVGWDELRRQRHARQLRGDLFPAKWKLVSAKRGRWELYDMNEDRTELNDLSGQYPECVKTMAKEWFRFAKEVDRLGERGLVPVRSEIAPLSFRK